MLVWVALLEAVAIGALASALARSRRSLVLERSSFASSSPSFTEPILTRSSARSTAPSG